MTPERASLANLPAGAVAILILALFAYAAWGVLR